MSATHLYMVGDTCWTACGMESEPIPGPRRNVTDDVRRVTCGRCKRTTDFRRVVWVMLREEDDD